MFGTFSSCRKTKFKYRCSVASIHLAVVLAKFYWMCGNTEELNHAFQLQLVRMTSLQKIIFLKFTETRVNLKE